MVVEVPAIAPGQLITGFKLHLLVWLLVRGTRSVGLVGENGVSINQGAFIKGRGPGAFARTV